MPLVGGYERGSGNELGVRKGASAMVKNLGSVRRMTRGHGGRAPLLWMRLIGCLALLIVSVAFSSGALFPSAVLSAQEASPVAAGATPTDDPVAAAKARVEQATAHVT